MAKKDNVIRVLVADDHPIVRDGIRAYLNSQVDIELIGEAADGEEAIRKTLELSPDILILDVRMPQVHGLAVAKQLRHTAPGTKIIALSVYENKECVVGMVRSQARAYLAKSAAPSELVEAIKNVHRGSTFFSRSVAKVIVADYVKHAEMIGEASSLSKQEKRILQQIAEGYGSRDIAESFGISRRTVETHRLHIRKKLGLDKTTNLATYAAAKGIVQTEAGRTPKGRAGFIPATG